jgi:hypothetical protein
MEKPYNQSYEKHARTVFGFHVVAFALFMLNLAWSIYRLKRSFSAASAFARVDAGIAFLLAVALILLFFYARLFALTVQDRVIRLEMTLRLERLLPPDLRSRFHEFNVDQLVALRFAGDEELPELARRVLMDNLTDRKTIKKMIKKWRPDFLRV